MFTVRPYRYLVPPLWSMPNWDGHGISPFERARQVGKKHRLEQVLSLPGMGNRTAWSAAGGTVVVVCGTNAVAWAAAASAKDSHLLAWPAYVFGAFALLGLYVVIGSLTRLWPFAGAHSVREVLDDCIRSGQEARERILYLGLSNEAERIEYATWFLRTANLLGERVPAVVDEFRLAKGDESKFSGQALFIQHINAQIEVLKRMGGER